MVTGNDNNWKNTKLSQGLSLNSHNEWNEWMFNDTPAQKIIWLVGVKQVEFT